MYQYSKGKPPIKQTVLKKIISRINKNAIANKYQIFIIVIYRCEVIEMAKTSKKAKEPTAIDVLMTDPSDSNTKAPKKTITINLETETIDYFKAAANRLGVPYQTLINLCLNDVRDRELVPQLHWENKKQ